MSLTKKEIQNILSKDWDLRRAKNKERARKGSELTKKWKKQEATLKFLTDIQEASKKRRPNYITTPGAPSPSQPNFQKSPLQNEKLPLKNEEK